MELMVDIETLSVHPDATVLSIGAVAFDPVIGLAPVSFESTLDRASQKGRRIDSDTVAWWIHQAEENPGASHVFRERRLEPVNTALARLSDYYRHWCTEDSGVWANGPDFDLVILRSLYEDFSSKPLWTHRQHRCYRTLRNFALEAGLEINIKPNMKPHDALSDAYFQAEYAMEAMKQLGVFA